MTVLQNGAKAVVLTAKWHPRVYMWVEARIYIITHAV
jgi:hypothetical protein